MNGLDPYTLRFAAGFLLAVTTLPPKPDDTLEQAFQRSADALIQMAEKVEDES